MNEQEAQERRSKLWELLGPLPPLDRPIEATVIEERLTPSYRLERLMLDLNGIEEAPAFFVSPLEAGPRRPLILYHHAHGNDWSIGKNELLAGRPELVTPPYAEVLASMGFNVLCIDQWNFGERQGRTESAVFKEMLWRGQVLFGMMIYDSLRALDYAKTRLDVDPRHVGVIGMSMGATLSWWLAALEPRISVCVDLCCMSDFQSLLDRQAHDGHGLYYFVPQLLNHFTAAQINELIAPRPHLILAGDHDPLTPPEGLNRIDAHLRSVYESMNASECYQMRRFQIGHHETTAVRRLAVQFLGRWLL